MISFRVIIGLDTIRHPHNNYSILLVVRLKRGMPDKKWIAICLNSLKMQLFKGQCVKICAGVEFSYFVGLAS